MRILVAEFAHESNVFCAGLTGFAAFAERELLEGPEVLERHAGLRTVLGGFIDAARDTGVELVPAIAASALPSGPVAGEVFAWAWDAVVSRARVDGSIDGALLSLHGAMSVDPEAGIDDPEGQLVAGVRLALGPQAPIGVVLDPHSDTTDLLLANATFTLAYNEEPHRDAYERGVEAAELLARVMRGEVLPVAARVHPPLLLPAINLASDHGPMRALHRLRATLEGVPGVLDISLHGGFYGSDQPEAGFGVVCTTNGDRELARRLAQQIAEEAWQRREEFLVALTPIDQAIATALAANEPVGLIDEADDPAGGGAADSVAILHGMLAGGVRSGGVSTVKDPEVARLMAAAGEGAALTVTLGGKTDRLHGDPLVVTGQVARIHRAPIPTDSWSGRTYDAGTIGVLDVGGILVVVTERRVVSENIDIFEVLGYDARRLQVVAFKGLGLHIRQALAGKIARFIPVDGVGVTHPDVRRLGPYTRVRRPVWPLDDIPGDAWPGTSPPKAAPVRQDMP